MVRKNKYYLKAPLSAAFFIFKLDTQRTICEHHMKSREVGYITMKVAYLAEKVAHKVVQSLIN
ncbi:hypothetical protein CN601_09345 [Bacillus sp. AFS017336]|nr:hypothetical protein CN601_09345 [Bacillus sp. AFS017336]